jgi:tRNA(Ile)-lysidine synthase
MHPLLGSVDAFLRRHVISRAAGVLAAVSGGADSVALLHALLSLGQRLGVAHVHHGLRGSEADRDLAFARELAAGLGVPFFSAQVDARRRRKGDGRSPEARARELRYGALEELRARHGFDHVATAHTLDDQAETLLLRALRGTTPAGLAGIRPRARDGRLLRPLLGVRRAELVEYLRARGHAWCEDSTNASPSIPRNRIRAELLPVLEAIAPGAAGKLAALAAQAHDLRLHLEAVIESELSGAVREGDGGLWLDRRALLGLPAFLQGQALAGLLARAGLEAGISRAQLARVSHFAASSRRGGRLSLPLGASLFCDGDALWLGAAPAPAEPGEFRAELRPPEGLEIPERGTRLVWRRSGGHGAVPDEVLRAGARSLCVSDEIAASLVARSPLARDRIQLGARERALQELFGSARWSRRARARAVVVESRSRPIWVVGLACAPEFRGPRETGWELRAEPFDGRGELLEFHDTTRG